MLWSIVVYLLLGAVVPETPGRIGLSMMVNVDPKVELLKASETQGANRALIMIFWNYVEGDSIRRSSYKYEYYDDIMNNLPDTMVCLASFGWGTPRWASRAKWLLERLLDTVTSDSDSTKWINKYNKYIRDRYFPPRPDSLQDGDSVVAYMDLWLKFVRTTVERYRSRIKYYEIWYEMDGEPPAHEPWKSDYINTMKDTAWFFEHFYKPTARAIYSVCPECKLVLPPRAGGNTLYDSYASFIDSSLAANLGYNNHQKGKFYGYYDRMFKYFSEHPTIDSVDSTNWSRAYPSFEYVDIHLYPYRYAPYYVDSNGVLLDSLLDTWNIRRSDHKVHPTVTNYTIKGAIDLVERLANAHGIGNRINGYFLTEVGYLTYPPDTTETYDSIHNIKAGFGSRMYLMKSEYFLNSGDENTARNIMDFMYSSVLNYDTAAIYFSMLEELLEYLNDHGKRVIMALPVTLKDGPYPYLKFEPWAGTYGFLFDLRDVDTIPQYGFKPKPIIYTVGLYQRYASRKYLMTRYEKPFENPESPKIIRTDGGFKIYYTHGRRDITDQIVTLRGSTVTDTEITNDTYYSTTPVFVKQNHHIYIAEANEDGRITGTSEESEGDDDSPAYIEFTADDNPNEKIKYLFYRHNKRELWLHHVDEIMPDSRLISDWRGVVYTGSDSISYAAVYRGQNDTLYIAFVDYGSSRDELHVLRFRKSREVARDETVYTFSKGRCGSGCGIGTPVFIKADPKTEVEFILLFTEMNGSHHVIKYLLYNNSGWTRANKFKSLNSSVAAMKGIGYLSSYVLGILKRDGILRVLRGELREEKLEGYRLVDKEDILIDSIAGSFDMAEYGGLWYVVYEKMGHDTVAFYTRLPSSSMADSGSTMITNEKYRIEEKFPKSSIGLAILEENRGDLQLAFDDKDIKSSKMLFCKEPVTYVDTANKKLRIWYNLGGYGTYVLKGMTYELKPSVVITSYPRVIQYGQGFSVQFHSYPGGENQRAGVAIERYEITVKEKGRDVVYDTTIYTYDTIPKSYTIHITPIENDTESWYTVKVTAYSAISFTASNEQGPIYGRFIKMRSLPEDNKRWMVSSEDTVYIANEGAVRKHILRTKIQAGYYGMVRTSLLNMSEEDILSGYYLKYYKHIPSDTSHHDTMALGRMHTYYHAISHLTFGNTIEEEIDSFRETLVDTNFISKSVRLYKDTMFYVWKTGNEYYYCVTTKDTSGKIQVDMRRMYLSSSEVPKKPTIITSNGKVYIAYETEGNTVKLDITDMEPRLLKSYTYSGRLPELTVINSSRGDTVVLYYVERNGIIVRDAFIDTTLITRARIYNSTDSITWIGVHENNVIFTCIEKDGSINIGSAVRYMRKDDRNVWNTITVQDIRFDHIIGSPYREFIMPWVYRVNDTLLVMTWLEEVTWGGNTEYGGWIRIYNPETGNIQSGIIGIKTGLYRVMPNPTRGMLSIRYGVSKRMRVKIEVYDISGRKVKVIENGIKKPGVYTAVWDGRNERGKRVVPGVYIIDMKAGSFFKDSKKVIIAR